LEEGIYVIEQVTVRVTHQGLHDITSSVKAVVKNAGITEGLCTLYIQHTSASLLIQENYDPSARVDLENWLNRLVPENDSLYTHTWEGADDMPAHIKSALTAVSISVPVIDGQLALGTWQGVFLWEHRHQPCNRTVLAHLA
jgi:secondary thiamine-phosphate synthase enzyme